MDISGNRDITDRRVIILAREIEAHGLPIAVFNMAKLTEVTALGIETIAHAVIKGCPQLFRKCLEGSGPDDDSYHDAVTNMFKVAGRYIDVIYDASDDDSDDEEEEEEEGEEEDEDN